jgi:putative ABC transport system substrate-binding protein
MPQLEAEARQLGMKPLALYADGADDVDAAFARMRAERACALNVLESPILSGLMSRIVQRAHEHRLPAIVQWPEQVHAGALMGYGPERQGAYDQAMEKAARVLRGEKPGDIPIEQPLLFRLAVNQRLAREMGLKLPAALLARADEVVE